MAKSRPRARGPKVTDPELSAEDARRSFERQFPDIDLDELLADTANRQKARVFSTRVSRELLIRTWGMAFPTADGTPVKFYFGQLRGMIESDAKVAGNLGAVETLLSREAVEQLRELMSLGEKQGLRQLKQLIGEVLQVPSKEEGVIECRTGSPQTSK